MTDPRIPLKNRALAGLLAFLFPGAGHLYQGRHFKAAIYSVCIVALFLTGMAMADWKAVQPPGRISLAGRTLYDDGRNEKTGSGLRSLKFVAQGSMGLPALVSLVQNKRMQQSDGGPLRTLDGPLTTKFTGSLELSTPGGLQEGAATGTLKLQPVAGKYGSAGIDGTFQGTFNGEPVELALNELELGPALGAAAQRSLHGLILDSPQGPRSGRISGTIPRPLRNHFMMTMTSEEENELQGKLGRRHELAMVLTWIAGLLNILVIWDAVEGPAYGYGDEDEQPEAKPSGIPAATGPPPTPEPAPAAPVATAAPTASEAV